MPLATVVGQKSAFADHENFYCYCPSAFSSFRAPRSRGLNISGVDRPARIVSAVGTAFAQEAWETVRRARDCIGARASKWSGQKSLRPKPAYSSRPEVESATIACE